MFSKFYVLTEHRHRSVSIAKLLSLYFYINFSCYIFSFFSSFNLNLFNFWNNGAFKNMHLIGNCANLGQNFKKITRKINATTNFIVFNSFQHSKHKSNRENVTENYQKEKETINLMNTNENLDILRWNIKITEGCAWAQLRLSSGKRAIFMPPSALLPTILLLSCIA